MCLWLLEYTHFPFWKATQYEIIHNPLGLLLSMITNLICQYSTCDVINIGYLEHCTRVPWSHLTKWHLSWDQKDEQQRLWKHSPQWWLQASAKAVRGEGTLGTQGNKGGQWGGAWWVRGRVGSPEGTEKGRGQRIQSLVADVKAGFGTYPKSNEKLLKSHKQGNDLIWFVFQKFLWLQGGKWIREGQ